MRWWVLVLELVSLLLVLVAAEGVTSEGDGRLPETEQVDMDNSASLNEEAKRAWSSLHGGWGKRSWQLLNTAWGKRAWRDMAQPMWGKREWQDMASAWGKRGWQDMSSAWGKRRWEDMNAAWGKRAPEKWSNFHGSWGKREAPQNDDYDKWTEQLILPLALVQGGVEFRHPEKRAWTDIKGAWGKRGHTTEPSSDE